MGTNHKRPDRSLVPLTVFVVAMTAGCSSWPWKSGGRESERLTRVIHAENSRLKDVVVQLRSSNEDMAQRALDDANRIARLEEENDRFRTSIMAYQSERERMARSFQNLQEQVQLALGDRAEVQSTSFTGSSTGQQLAADLNPNQPPEGRISTDGSSLLVPLNEWFNTGTAVLKSTNEARLSRLGRWLMTRIDHQGVVTYLSGSSKGKSGPNSQVGIDGGGFVDPNEFRENLGAIDSLRARRLWESLLDSLPADSAARIRFEETPIFTDSKTGQPTVPTLVIPLDVRR